MTKEIKVIDDFLTNWKESARKYYTDRYNQFAELSDAAKIKRQAFFKLHNVISNSWTEEVKKEHAEIAKPLDALINAMSNSEYGIIDKMRYGYKKLTDSAEILNIILDKEVEIKKVNLINRIEKKAGEIKEVNLYIGVDGNINGVVQGSNARVIVTTIYAGGYNIQCLHYRVLVK